MPEAAKCAWEVTAGLIPGQPMAEYTRRWALTSAEWYGEDGEPSATGVALFNASLGADRLDLVLIGVTKIKEGYE